MPADGYIYEVCFIVIPAVTRGHCSLVIIAFTSLQEHFLRYAVSLASTFFSTLSGRMYVFSILNIEWA